MEFCKQWCADVILMALLMPYGDGAEASYEIKLECTETKVIVLTSSNDNHLINLALEAGVDPYLSKTISVAKLSKAIYSLY